MGLGELKRRCGIWGRVSRAEAAGRSLYIAKTPHATSARGAPIRWLKSRKIPAGGGVYEIFGVLVESEGFVRTDAEDERALIVEECFDVAAVFPVVSRNKSMNLNVIADLGGLSFEDDRFLCVFCGDNTV